MKNHVLKERGQVKVKLEKRELQEVHTVWSYKEQMQIRVLDVP